MKSEPLQPFRFVDRSDELTIACEFIENEISDFEDSNLLWLHGHHNNGLSRLLEEIARLYEHDNNFFVVRIIAKDGISDEAIVSEFISELRPQGASIKDKFIKYIPKVGAEIASTALSESSSIELLIAKAVLSAGIILTESGDGKSPYQITAEYIQRIAEKTASRIVIIVDGITRLSDLTIDFLLNIAVYLSHADDLRMIIGSHNEDESKALLERLVSSFGIHPINVLEFGDQKYFYALLSDYFQDLHPESKIIKRIYESCKHSVGCLRDNLVNYYLTVGKVSDMDISQFADSIELHKCELANNLFALHYMTILKILQTSVSINHLDQMLLAFIENNLHFDISDDSYFEYERASGFNVMLEAGGAFCDDYYVTPSVNKYISIHPYNDFIYTQCIYDYLSKLSDQDRINVFKDNDFDSVFARLAWDAQASNRVEINIAYAHYAINSGYKYRYMEPILRIASIVDIQKTHEDDILRFALVSYESGEYFTAKRLLENLQKKSTYEGLYQFELLFGKVCNVLGNLEGAIQHLTKAKKAANNSDDLITATSMLQLAYQELPGGRDTAKRLFHDNMKLVEAKHQWSLADCMAIRTSVDFWNGEDDILSILYRAVIETQKENNLWCESCLRVACGLQLLRAGKNDCAKDELQKACSRLSIVRPHEQAYVKNDIALCEMIKGNYSEALTMFRDARLWAVSPYIKLNILGNAMVCLALLRRNDEAIERVKEAVSNVLAGDNSLILAKLCMQIAYVLLITGSTSKPLQQRPLAMFDECLKKAEAQGLSPRNKRRVAKYRNCCGMNESDARQELSNRNATYNEVDFTPWFSTLHHD